MFIDLNIEMPSPILPFTTQNQLTYSRLARQIDLDLILTRIRSAVDDSDSAYLNYDKTYREYKAKQEERRQKLINRGSIVQPPVEKVQVALRDKLGKEKYVRGENN